ncbi:hypothetical protein, partial [Acetobacter pasteurianus]|uniref:hypothetical protein n=1 Tax=Acetobacter pasteurianus TaxID=438 RepID=UPI00249208D2
MSIPTAGKLDGTDPSTSRSHWTDANHCPARRDKVMLRIIPGRAYQPRKATHPSLGSLMRPVFFPVRSTRSEAGSGKR